MTTIEHPEYADEHAVMLANYLDELQYIEELAIEAHRKATQARTPASLSSIEQHITNARYLARQIDMLASLIHDKAEA